MQALGTQAAKGSAGSLVLVAWGVVYRSLVRRIGQLDELQRRIHLEALVVAFPLAVMLLMLLGLLDLVVDLSPDDWSFRHVWPMLLLFYCVGYLVARRRYE